MQAGGRMHGQRIVLMGVAGCGKSSVGVAMAARTGMVYRDGDDLHPAANIAKMRAGLPLTDADRWPWLALVGAALVDLAPDSSGTVVGCSALKRAYRDQIARHAGAPVLYVHLAGNRRVIAARLRARTGHFMPESLIESQFAALEPPGPDENALTIEIDRPFDAVIDTLAAALANRE